MNILEILGVDVAQPYVIGTFSTAGQGKSTLMASFVKELSEKGKTVSIITDESVKLWVRRLSNLEIIKNLKDENKIYIKKIPYGGNHLDFIKKQKNERPEINCIFLDISIVSRNKQELFELCQFIRDNGMMLFLTSNSKSFPNKSVVVDSYSAIQSMDCAVSITRINPKKLSFFKRLVNFIVKPLGLNPYKVDNKNVRLNVVKNRRGSNDMGFDLSLDFEKINRSL
jgi:hypothetical protein